MMSLGERFLLAATVTDVLDRQYMYEACKTCYTKLLDTGKSLIAENVYYRYCVHLTAADSSCLANITLFGSVLDTFFGAACSEFYFSHVLKLKDKYGTFVDTVIKVAIEKTFIGQNLIFGFKVPKSFCSKKGKNCEISLKDITRISPNCWHENNPHGLPELIAVQLLPQTNANFSFTVIQTLDILEKRIQEMGYLQLNENASDFIQVIKCQNTELCNSSSDVVHLNSSTCSFDSTQDFTGTSLGLSCDTSLASQDDIQSPGILKPMVSCGPSRVSPALSENAELNPLPSKLRGGKDTKTSMVHSCREIKDIRDIDRSKRPKENNLCTISKTNRTCRSQKFKSSNQEEFFENKLVEDKLKLANTCTKNHKMRKTDGVSSQTSWSVVKYNREVSRDVSSPVKLLKLGKVENPTEDSKVWATTNSLRKTDIKCSSTAYEGCDQLNFPKGKELNQTLERDAYSHAYSLRHAKENTFDVDQMPESEDLELFLAAANADASANVVLSSESPTWRKKSPIVSENFIHVSQNAAKHHSEQTVLTHNKTDLQDESLFITDDYVQSISFNVTVRRSRKRQQCGFQFSPPCSNTNNILETDPPESENLWQFLDRFSVGNTPDNSAYNLQKNNHFDSWNVSMKKHDESAAAIEETLNSIPDDEVKNSEDLFTSPAETDQQQSDLVGAENYPSKTTLLTNPLHFNSASQVKENDALLSKVSNAKLSTPHRVSESGEELVIPSSSQFLDDISFITLSTKTTSDILNSCKGVPPTHKGAMHHQKEDKSEYLIPGYSFSSNKDYCNTSNDSLLSNSLDLFNSPECSRMHLGMNLSSDKSCQEVKNSSPLNLSQNNSVASQNELHRGRRKFFKGPPRVSSDKVFYKKVRFTSQRTEYYFHDFDCIQTWARPLRQKTLKSCLKLQKNTQCYDTSSYCITRGNSISDLREVNSEDLFADEEEHSRRKLSSSPSYNDSLDLFSQSPDISSANRKYSALPSPHSRTVTLLCDSQSGVGRTGFDNSLELFSQSEISSTPICHNSHQVLSLQDCVTPDLFD